MPEYQWLVKYYDAGKMGPTWTQGMGDIELGSILGVRLAQGWTLHPYNSDGNNQVIEWILSEAPTLSVVGAAYAIRRIT